MFILPQLALIQLDQKIVISYDAVELLGGQINLQSCISTSGAIRMALALQLVLEKTSGQLCDSHLVIYYLANEKGVGIISYDGKLTWKLISFLS